MLCGGAGSFCAVSFVCYLGLSTQRFGCGWNIASSCFQCVPCNVGIKTHFNQNSHLVFVFGILECLSGRVVLGRDTGEIAILGKEIARRSAPSTALSV